MSLKEIPSHTCNAELSAGKSSVNTATDNLITSSISRRSSSIAGSPKGEASKHAFTPQRSKTLYTDKSTVNVCQCSDCTNPEDIPKQYLQELKDQIQALQSDLIIQRNDNHMLKRHLLMAKWVVNKETGEDFDCLMKKASDESWMGRQEKILSLRRELRELNETVEHLESEMKVPPSRKRTRRIKEKPPEIFPDHRTTFWCLELERQEVWRNAEREKQKIIASRDTMKNKLESLIARKEELTKQASNLREKISAIPKVINGNEVLEERLQELENKLKTHLKEKAEAIQKLEDLEQQICRNYKSVVEVKGKINIEKQTLKNTEAKLKSLKELEANFKRQPQEARGDKCKQMAPIRKKLDEADQDYKKLIIRSEKTMNLIANGKECLRKLKPRVIDVGVDIRKPRALSQCVPRNESSESQELNTDKSELSVEMLTQNSVRKYENKLSKYKSMFRHQENRNEGKLRMLFSIVNSLKDETSTLVENRCVLWEVTGDTNVLRNRWKKFRKAFAVQSKQKQVKKKVSNTQLVGILEERKIILDTWKTENKFLKTLLSSVFDSREEDYELLECFLRTNRGHFLKNLLKA